MSYLELKNIEHIFNTEVKLHHINLNIPKGSLCLLINEVEDENAKLLNEELLKIVSGILEPQKGQVLYSGVDIYKNRHIIGRKSSFVFKKGGLLSNLTVEENIMLMLDYHRPELTKLDKKKMIKDKLKMFGVGYALESRPDNLSESTQKAVLYIRSIINNPDLVCMVEPLIYCDTHIKSAIIQDIKKRKKQYNTTFLITDKTTIKYFIDFADLFIFMQDGAIEIVEDDKYTAMAALQIDKNLDYI